MATLNSDEVNALMDAIKDGRVEPEPAPGQGKQVAPYDLTSRDRIIRGQMPTLDAINEQISSMLATGLAGRTRLNLKISSSPATLMKFVDFNSLLAPPTIVGVLSLGQGHGLALAVLEPGLGEALLAAALGDRKVRPDESAVEPRRELTSVERLVLKRLLGLLTDAMTRAWASVLPFRPEVLRFESDPRLATIAPHNEAAILSTFEISGALTGRLQLAIPFAAVEGVKKLLSSPMRVSTGQDAKFTAALQRELEQIEVELCAELGHVALPISRLLSLEVGDVLMLDSDEGAAITVTVEGRAKMTGHPHVVGGSNALVLEKTLDGKHKATLDVSAAA
ncbi:MAG: FliM/FliN family flagellar motor switch protein [Myxococcaceae bacterium]|nr:FliM/FliN family flagellar motor switch protein [Myxococcaceae bacterium]